MNASNRGYPGRYSEHHEFGYDQPMPAPHRHSLDYPMYDYPYRYPQQLPPMPQPQPLREAGSSPGDITGLVESVVTALTKVQSEVTKLSSSVAGSPLKSLTGDVLVSSVARLVQENAELKASLEQRSTELAAANEKIAALHQKHHTWMQESNDSFERQTESMQKSIQQLRNNIAALQEHTASTEGATQQVAQLRNDHAVLEEKFKLALQRSESLTTQLSQAKAQLAAAPNATQLEAEKQRADDLATNLRQTEQQRDQLLERVEGLEQQALQLQQQVEQKQQQVEQQQQQQSSPQDAEELGLLREQVANLNRNLESIGNQYRTKAVAVTGAKMKSIAEDIFSSVLEKAGELEQEEPLTLAGLQGLLKPIIKNCIREAAQGIAAEEFDLED